MKTCIYCKKSEPEISFTSGTGEHIIPQFLGDFELFFGDDIVCFECNNGFSKFESIFKEDSLEGIYSAIWGIRETTTVRIRKDKLNWKISTDSGELGVFKDIFPFASQGESYIEPKPVIIIRPKARKSNTYDVLFVEKFAGLANKKNAEFRKRKEWIEGLKLEGKLDITLFGNHEWTIGRIKEVLKQYSIDYSETMTEHFEDKNRGGRWKVEFNAGVDDEILRLPVKIAFNYFAYCAKKSNMTSILYDENFDNLRNYIKQGRGRPIQIVNKPVLANQKDPTKRILLHILTFKREAEKITSEITLFGLFTYRIIIGRYPFQTLTPNFGCATGFNPFSGKIINDIYSVPYRIIGKPDYDLFRA